jgi:class 3 adenylate cyclase
MSAKSFSGRHCRKSLHSSLSMDEMIRLVRIINPDYNIYRRTGFSEGQPIPIQTVTTRIVTDIIQGGHYVDFVELLIKVDSEGYMGRRYAIRGLDDIIGDLIQTGYSYDKTSKFFFENQRERISKNWGRLKEDDERQMSVLRLDIAGNSTLVKENPRNLIEKSYGDMRKIVTRAVVSRLGRLWSWEGDGALSAFMLGSPGRAAILAGMEILHEMFLYNKLHNSLASPINIRLAVHSGSLRYSHDEAAALKNETVKTAVTLESKAALPNSLVISESLAVTQDQALLNVFSNEKAVAGIKYRMYQVKEEQT